MEQMKLSHSSRQVGVSKQEKYLVASLRLSLLKTVRSRSKHFVCTELDCFQGIADLVSGTPNGYRFLPSKTPRRRLKHFSFSTAKVLSALQGRKVTDSTRIAQATGLSKQTVRRQVRFLEELSLVRVEPRGRLRVTHEIKPPFSEIEAYEVKVRDWKGGLYQARNYRSFAHKVSLALPLRQAKQLKGQLGTFRRFKVGLVGIGNTAQLVWLVKPRRQKPISRARTFLASIHLLKKGAPRGTRASRPS
jgi:hypothetical protein